MKKLRTLNQKIITYVMAVSILLSVLITTIMSIGSVRSTNSVLLDNMQITARIASQNISSNMHLLTERMYNLSTEPVFTNDSSGLVPKQLRLDEAKLQIEFVWLSAYDLSGQKLYGDESAPDSITDTHYYEHLGETENMVISDPFFENDTLQLCVGAPIKSGKDGKVIGYLIGSYKYDLLNDVLSMLILGNTGTAYIINEEGTIIGDRNFQNIIDGKCIYDIFPASKNKGIEDKILAFQTGSALMKSNSGKHYAGYAPIPGTSWALLISAPQKDFMNTVLLSLLLSVLLSIVLFLTATAVIIPLARKIAASLSSATKRLQALSDGDLNGEVVLSDSTAETSVLTNALSATITNLNSYILNIQSCLGALSSGDYTIEIPDTFRGDFSSIRDSLCDITASLNDTMLQMHQSSVDVTQNSTEVSDHAKQLHDGSTAQDALLKQLETSMADITASIENNKNNVVQIEQCSNNAEEKTALGDSYMQSLLDSMSQINAAVEEISQISRLIEDISDQTNLLSLNASIEAARAGEAGRGFAIVASEIGQLSTQTADALHQTGNIIEHSINIIRNASETAAQTEQAFGEIRKVTAQYHEISEKLSATVSEQTTSVTYVNDQLAALQDIADRNRILAEQTDSLATASLSQSESLKNYVAQAKLKKFDV